MHRKLCLALALIALPGASPAMTIERVPACGGAVLKLRGDLLEGDYVRFRRQLKARRPVVGIDLSSNGGYLEEGMPMAKLVLDMKLPVYAAGECNSMCAVMFFAGARRYVAQDAKIGVHSISNQKRREPPESMAMTMHLSRLLSEDMGVPSAVIGKMVVTRPGRIAYLDAADLAALKAEAGNPFESATPAEPEAKPEARRDVEAASRTQGATRDRIRGRARGEAEDAPAQASAADLVRPRACAAVASAARP